MAPRKVAVTLVCYIVCSLQDDNIWYLLELSFVLLHLVVLLLVASHCQPLVMSAVPTATAATCSLSFKTTEAHSLGEFHGHVHTVSKLTNLQSFSYNGLRYPVSPLLAHLAALTNLQSLDITASPTVANRSNQGLLLDCAPFKSLTKLSVTPQHDGFSSSISDAFPALESGAGKELSMYVAAGSNIPMSLKWWAVDGLMDVSLVIGLTTLQCLVLGPHALRSGVAGSDYGVLCQLTALTDLRIAVCKVQDTPEFASFIDVWSVLPIKRLELCVDSVNAANLPMIQLGQLSKLEVLALYVTTDKYAYPHHSQKSMGLDVTSLSSAVKQMTNLTSFALINRSRFDVPGSYLLEALSGLPSLSFLQLFHVDLHDAVETSLSTSQQLTALLLTRCGVPKDAAARMQQELPHLRLWGDHSQQGYHVQDEYKMLDDSIFVSFNVVTTSDYTCGCPHCEAGLHTLY